MADSPAKMIENALLFTFCSSRLRARSKPGEAYEILPRRLKENLKKLKSDDLKNIRPDSIFHD